MKFASAFTVAALAAVCSATETHAELLQRYNAVIPQHGQFTTPVYERKPLYTDDQPIEEAEHKDAEVTADKNGRGSIKQPRRRDAPTLHKQNLERQPEVIPNRSDGKFHDWRDYEPDLFGGKDPYAHCVYPADTDHLDTPEYQALSAICKEELLWKLVLQDTRRERFYAGIEFESLFAQDMNLTYDVVTDNMPVDRLKKTHPVGTMSKIEVIPHPDQPYTGMFRGVKHGLMRISDTTKTVPHVQKTNPGFGIKFLRDGMTSANILAMFHFDGQNSWNFFKNRWVTILREPNNECARRTIGKHLASVTDHPGATSVMEVAQFDQYGNKEEEPHWPFQLEFEPYDVYGWTDEYQNDFQDQLTVIPMNTVMFKIFAYDVPPEHGGKERLIGWIASRSDQIDSFWGDTQLFFKHSRLDDDI